MPGRQLTTYQAVISQSRAFRALRQFMAASLDRHNLTVTEWLIIGTVIDHGPEGARISDLATALGVELPVITNLVNKAVATGWVERVSDPNDKRSKRIVASKDGMLKACDIEGELRESTKSWITGVDKEDFDSYFTVVGAMSNKY
jgi:MarR family transcriptional regulator, transcriptional regulator for hemolysin